MTRELSPVALAAKEIREQLKATFPNTKFKVQSDNYSMGSSIRVYWVDGPTTAEVETISNQKKKVRYCEASGEILNGGNQYVFTYRTHSEAVLNNEISKVLAKYQHNEVVDELGRSIDRTEIVAEQSKYDSTWDLSNRSYIKVCETVRHYADSVRDYVYKNLEDVSFVNARTVEATKPVATVEAIGGITVTENAEKNGVEIRFASKPDSAILDSLKKNGFRYSRNQNMWYAKRSPEALTIARNLASIASEFTPVAQTTSNDFSYLLGAANEQLAIEAAEIESMEDIDNIPADRLDEEIAIARAQVLALLPAEQVEEYKAISAEVVEDSNLSVTEFKQAANSGKVISLMAFATAIHREAVVKAPKPSYEVIDTFEVEPIVIAPQPAIEIVYDRPQMGFVDLQKIFLTKCLTHERNRYNIKEESNEEINQMTIQEKSQAMKLYLSAFDCYNDPQLIDPSALHFSYDKGSNEGGYMTIGGYMYRCNSSTEVDYLKAVEFYLTMV